MTNSPISSTVPDTRWYQVMTNLLYPAVLGTILYSLGDAMWDEGLKFFFETTGKLLLSIGLVTLFTFDYAYTLNDNSGKDYGPWQFLLDLSALILLFVAGKAILTKIPDFGAALPAMLLAVKLLALLYELSRLPSSRDSVAVAKAWRKYESDAHFVLAYFVIFSLCLLTRKQWDIVLAIAMLVDAMRYVKRLE